MNSRGIDRLLLCGVLVLTAGLAWSIRTGIHETIINKGDASPAFAIKTDNGPTVSVPNANGKIVILNFWASWCQPCVEETPSLSKLAADFAGKGVVVVGVSVDQDENAYKAFVQKYRPGFLTVRDLKLHEEFGTYMYPETYIIGRDGKVLEKIAEAYDWSDPRITQYIGSLL
jgi:thiol-disulfide isomerase/thioredoxin